MTAIRTRTTRRSIAFAAVATAIPLLASCSLLPGGDGSVSYDGNDSSRLQAATVQFTGQGTFVPLGASTMSEAGWFGSGFFISPDGTVVTNNHVVAGAGTLSVTIGGTGASYPARVLSTSECLDVAVVDVDVPQPVPYFGWAQGAISTGSDVYALGFPLGDPQFSMTRGVIVKSDYAFDTYDNVLVHGIQTDAGIRGGNSGGPLVNAQGKVVGVNFFGAEGLQTSNYAIGRDDILPVLEELKAGKSVLSLGLNLAAFAPDEDLGFGGIWVQSVTPGGAADAAGIEPGDILIKLAGVSLEGETSLSGDEYAGQGTMKHYCDVLKTKGVDAAMDLQVYRPTTDQLLEGQVNGTEPLEVVADGVLGGSEPEPADDFVAVQSDDGRIAVSVPSSWTDVVTQPSENGTVLQASTDLGAFGEFSAEGVELFTTGYQQVGPAADVLGILSGLADTYSCTVSEADEPYDDGYFAGFYSILTGCSTGADVALVAVDAIDQSASGYVMIIGTFGEAAASDPTVVEILNTFNLM